jgi:hypothetical protein
MHSPNASPEPDSTESRHEHRLGRMLFWIGFGVGLAALGTVLGVAAIRIASGDRREDPTTHRIQELIDEANSLLKALDEQRHSA